MEFLEIMELEPGSWHVHYGCQECSKTPPGIYCLGPMTEPEAHRCGIILKHQECACLLESQQYLKQYWNLNMYTKSYLLG